MIFDGSEIKVGDSVHDVAYGSGKVDRISEELGTLYVKFGNRGFTYDVNGHGTFPRKTLFWRDPIDTFMPSKQDNTWVAFTKIREVVMTTLKAI